MDDTIQEEMNNLALKLTKLRDLKAKIQQCQDQLGKLSSDEKQLLDDIGPNLAKALEDRACERLEK